MCLSLRLHEIPVISENETSSSYGVEQAGFTHSENPWRFISSEKNLGSLAAPLLSPAALGS